MTERDARDLVDWLDQAEEETKATIAEHERIDPFYDGVLSTVQTVREYIKKMRKVDEAEGEKQMYQWKWSQRGKGKRICSQSAKDYSNHAEDSY